jgi:hypothetical protein
LIFDWGFYLRHWAFQFRISTGFLSGFICLYLIPISYIVLYSLFHSSVCLNSLYINCLFLSSFNSFNCLYISFWISLVISVIVFSILYLTFLLLHYYLSNRVAGFWKRHFLFMEFVFSAEIYVFGDAFLVEEFKLLGPHS